MLKMDDRDFHPSIAFSPDGKYMFYYRNEFITVKCVGEGLHIAVFKHPENEVFQRVGVYEDGNLYVLNYNVIRNKLEVFKISSEWTIMIIWAIDFFDVHLPVPLMCSGLCISSCGEIVLGISSEITEIVVISFKTRLIIKRNVLKDNVSISAFCFGSDENFLIIADGIRQFIYSLSIRNWELSVVSSTSPLSPCHLARRGNQIIVGSQIAKLDDTLFIWFREDGTFQGEVVSDVELNLNEDKHHDVKNFILCPVTNRLWLTIVDHDCNNAFEFE